MRVLRGSQVIGAVLKDVGPGAEGVKRGQIVLRHADGDGFARTGLQDLGLAVADELDRGLFDLILAVIVGIGLLRIDLHGLLAGNVAGVGDLDRQLIGGLLALAAALDSEIGEVEGGIAQAVAEGIGHDAVIAEIAGLGRAEHNVLIAGLGILVAEIDALLVDDILAVGRERGEVIVVGAFIEIRAEVVHHRIQPIVHPPGVGQ